MTRREARSLAWCEPQHAREAKPPVAGVAGEAALLGGTKRPNQGEAVDAPTASRFSRCSSQVRTPPHSSVPPEPPPICPRSSESSAGKQTETSGGELLTCDGDTSLVVAACAGSAAAIGAILFVLLGLWVSEVLS